MLCSVRDDVVETGDHNLFELLINLRFSPEISLPILHPLEVGHRDTAGVCQYVGDYEDSLFGEDRIGDEGGWAVCALAEDFGFDTVGVGRGDHIFARRWKQNVTV